MAAPPTYKTKKDGVVYESNADLAIYTITELTRAALRDVAKLVKSKMFIKLKKLPGMSKQAKRGGRLKNSTQSWVRKRDTDLQIGFKHDTWYGVWQELGTRDQPARHILRDTVYENINEIRKIEAHFLKYIEDIDAAKSVINEEAEVDADDS